MGKADGACEAHQVSKEGTATPGDTEVMGTTPRGGRLHL